jgi:hypothetical protein
VLCALAVLPSAAAVRARVLRAPRWGRFLGAAPLAHQLAAELCAANYGRVLE